MRWIFLLMLCALPMSLGCSKPAQAMKDKKDGPGMAEMHRAKAEAPAAGVAFDKKGDAEFVAAQEGDKKDDKKAKPDQPRKVRYTSDMRLVVADFVKAEEELDAAITAAKGLLAGSETNTSTGAVRSGTWRIRVPVDNFRDFRKTVAKLGEVEKNTVESEDMTDAYYDLEAHIKNRVAARDAMRDRLKLTGDRDMTQYLAVWRELESISDDINRKEGKLRLWANQTDLTTLTVHMRQKLGSQPEPPVKDKIDPTFSERAGSTWTASWDLFVGALQWVVLVVIALTPWAPIPLAFLLAFALVVRRIARAKA